VRLRERHQCAKDRRHDLGIRIEEQEVPSLGRRDALVDRGREAAVLAVRDQMDLREPAERLQAAVRGRVVHHQDLESEVAAEPPDRREARLEKGPGVVVHDDDG
jgi:hypothetical protein